MDQKPALAWAEPLEEGAAEAPAGAVAAMIVELTGSRGVGKTTLAPLIVAALDARGVTVASVPPPSRAARISLVLRGLLPRLRVQLLVRRWRTSSLDHRHLDRRMTHYLRRLMLYRQHPGVHVTDRGIGQMMMTLHMEVAGGDMDDIWRAMSIRVPLPDLMVLLEASDDTVAERRAKRRNAGDRRWPRLAPNERTTIHALKTTLAVAATTRERVDFMAVASGDDTADQIADYIVRRLGNVGSP